MNKTLVERKTKPVNPDEFWNTHEAAVREQHTEIKQGGIKINKTIKEINDAVQIEKRNKEWKNYQ